ncbi:MAG: alanine--tRNA ligase [Clostridiales Family XIII bacterium]|jgi:alanyl-tRNA synthetase|nr:alanine--tRNA ligase [Clostridiales Family XIII bacterium]
MTAQELRRLYIDFFVSRNHKEIASASLIPENDPSVLFTTAGMHPLVPYLLGEKHPSGQRLVDHQKCLRTGDIDAVGDASHLTFFEMMGNWSLGDYFKKESITMSHEFLTQELGIPQDKISVTVFAGDESAERDEESADVWRSLGYPDERIYYFGKKENWWGPAGITGPCGPDTEIFFDTGKEKCSENCNPACSCGKYVEIWNNVFMQYNKDTDGNYTLLVQKNVDTGLGLERVLAIMNDAASVFDTELFVPIISKIEELTGVKYEESVYHQYRVVADHLRASTFILGDDKGIAPGNVDQGYVLRRLIRRAYRYLVQMEAPTGTLSQIAQVIIDHYKDVYPELGRNEKFIIDNLDKEDALFGKTLAKGLKIATKFMDAVGEDKVLKPEDAFMLYDTYGFPLEFTQELAEEKGIAVDAAGFNKLFEAHQEKSRQGAAQKFKGGLADNSEETTKLHTATHLLNAALRKVLGDDVYQRGSNITPDRLRFDFSFDRKMTPEEIAEVEQIVNDVITAGIDVVCEEMSPEEAKAQGAIGVFTDKYGELVKVYTVGDYTKEICGGPHAGNTADLGSFKIQKESSSSSGVRRIKAVIGK